MQVRTFYDLLAPLYRRYAPSYLELVTRRAVQRLCAGGPGSVLDVGIGPGHGLVELIEKTGARTVGVDISKGMLSEARRLIAKSNRQAGLVQGDALALPFASGSFEGVVASFLLGLLPREQIPAALAEMGRVLAPGGRLVVASLRIPNGLVKRIWMLAYDALPDVVGHLRPIDITAQLGEMGFRVLQEEEVSVGVGTRLVTSVKVRG